MDPIVLAAGTALVGAMATDAWEQVREAITSLWHRAHKKHAGGVGAEVDELRRMVLQARAAGDSGTERALEGAWQLKLQGLLRADPGLASELRRVLDHVLTPALPSAERQRIGTIIMTGSSHDSSTFRQIGVQNRFGQP
jgi:hypothetical protein